MNESFLQHCVYAVAMRRMKYYTLPAIMIVLIYGIVPVSAQKTGQLLRDSAIRQGHFAFHAQWAVSYNGHRTQLMPTYTFLGTSDSIWCYLPFIGRTYTVPVELRFMAIDFTSRKFSFNAKRNRRGEWHISIRPSDVHDITALTFSISKNGWATLLIQSVGRDPMTYEGIVDALE